MELEGLAGGQAQRFRRHGRARARRASAIAAGVQTPPGSRTRTMKLIGRLELLPPPLVAQVAIVLLIDAVELHQLGVVAGHGRR